MYAKFFKRVLDVLVALTGLTVLFPVLLALTLIGTAAMGGNPFFTQLRPGKNEKLFRLVKFRSMNNRRDARGELLPDEKRLTGYGRFLRASSLDELPELWNILRGDMSLVGPRPLLVKYLPLYTEAQRHRHDVRPGLTGYAQVHGRNAVSWEERFVLDLQYIENITFRNDITILFHTVRAVLRREGIHSETAATMEEFKGTNA
jgi:lipopolysaccharide/colanic/teichoic acid biosynthesis glycosyltransferase